MLSRGRGWRSRRPFWGGVLICLSAAFLLLPAFTSLRIGDLLITITSIAGVSTLLLGALMAVCGAAVIARPDTRIPAGVSAMILALVALPAANFGGFVLGTLLGVVGAASVLAWSRRASPDRHGPSAVVHGDDESVGHQART